MLENRNITDEERISQLEKELEETILLGEESDRKFEEVSIVHTSNIKYIEKPGGGQGTSERLVGCGRTGNGRCFRFLAVRKRGS